VDDTEPPPTYDVPPEELAAMTFVVTTVLVGRCL
jgi:hypothetical protein